jgi:hypothetical protein
MGEKKQKLKIKMERCGEGLTTSKAFLAPATPARDRGYL